MTYPDRKQTAVSRPLIPERTWHETLIWLAGLGVEGFVEDVWYVEIRTDGRERIHYKADCPIMLSTDQVAITGYITEDKFATATLCINCGLNFIDTSGTVAYLQAREMDYMYTTATRMRTASGTEEETCPALYSILVAHVMQTLLKEMVGLGPICPALAVAHIKAKTAVEQTRQLHKIDLTAARQEAILLGAKEKLGTLTEHSNPAVDQIYQQWLETITSAERRKPEEAFCLNKNYPTLQTELPCKEVVTGWEQLLQQVLCMQHETVFYSWTRGGTVKLYGRDLPLRREACYTVRSAVVLLGLKISDTNHGIGELPKLAAEWLATKESLLTGHVEILNCSHQDMSQEGFEMALALWNEGRDTLGSPYQDAGAAFNAAAKL